MFRVFGALGLRGLGFGVGSHRVEGFSGLGV